MANEIKKELIQKKLDLVIQKLMHLGAPENEDTLTALARPSLP